MNSTNTHKSTVVLPGWQRPLFLLVLACAVSSFAIESRSFWIDEANTALHAVQPTFTSWRMSLSNSLSSDAQMPFFMFYAWAWEKIFGHGEWWLRLSNLPWLVLCLLAVPRRQTIFLVVFLISPFVWYYLDEFRPYLMQISAAMLMFGSLGRLMEVPGGLPREKYLVATFCLGLLLLSGSSLLGMVWGGAILGMSAMIMDLSRTLQLARKYLLFILPTVLLLSALALYFLWAIKKGDNPTQGTTNIQSTLFCFYEMMGFAGLGPGRAQLHADGVAPLRPFIPLLAFQALVTLCVLVAGAGYVVQKTPRRIWLWAMTVLLSATLLLLILGMVKNFRVLGRHLSPLEPAVLWVLACGVRDLWLRNRYWQAVALVFILLNLSSALELRFAWRHVKDDYRDAAAVAIAANRQGKQVWWCADGNSGLYYGVPLAPLHQLSAPGQVWEAIDKPLDTLKLLISNETPADVVILSKPEIYDGHRVVCSYLTDHHFLLSQTYPAVTIWKKQE